MIFLSRFAIFYSLFNWHYRWGFDFKFWRPGFEVKSALEAAENVGAKIVFMGPELDTETWDRL
jgi:pheromone shutdown protein TraB